MNRDDRVLGFGLVIGFVAGVIAMLGFVIFR